MATQTNTPTPSSWFKVSLQLLTWNNENGPGSCYAYSNRQSSPVSFFGETDVDCSLSVIDFSKPREERVQKSGMLVTVWLNDCKEDKETAQLYAQTYGKTAYVNIETKEMITVDDFKGLQSSQDAAESVGDSTEPSFAEQFLPL